MCDEELDDILEWLWYYKWLGVDHVFLTDNGSKDAERILTTLRATFPGSSYLSLRTEVTPHAQMQVYGWCAKEHQADFNWMAFLDLDEYLALRPSATPAHGSNASSVPLKAFLHAFRGAAGVAAHWIMVGPSGQESRPPGGGVLQHYTQCVPSADARIKTIANMYYLDGIGPHPHNFWFRNDMRAIDEHGNSVGDSWKVGRPCRTDTQPTPLPPGFQEVTKGECIKWGVPEAAGSRPSRFAQCCQLIPAATIYGGTVDTIAIYHYATRSRADFEVKILRGSGAAKDGNKDWTYFDAIQGAQKEDPICEELAPVWDQCCGRASQ